MENKIKIFDSKEIRTVWNDEEEDWYFSVVDVVAVLTDSSDPKQYIKKMRSRDNELNSKWGTICTPVEMIALDGKHRKIQAANTKGVLRLIQSVPSPKAEPFKMWLAQLGSDRIDEIADPEKAIVRGTEYYRKKGYSEEWINQRMQAIAARKELTDEWKARGINDDLSYAILTNDITHAWSGMTVRDYKNYKGLTKENLRDNMTNIELALNMLAEVTTTELSKQQVPKTFEENRTVARRGGTVAKHAREDVENQLGRSVISPTNADEIKALKPMDEILKILVTECKKITGVEKIVLFGSRARGDFTERSDYDIAFYGNISLSEKFTIKDICDEQLPTLHKIDTVFMAEQKDNAFIDRINSEGIVIYDKT